MFRELRIQNFKSIVDITIPLGRVNVFIGANGSGKSNILEAIAMMSAAKENQLNPQTIFNKGVRVAKPNLTVNSFIGLKPQKSIYLSLKGDNDLKIESRLTCSEPDNIFAKWIDEVEVEESERYKEFYERFVTPEKVIKAGADMVGEKLSEKQIKDIVEGNKDSKEFDIISTMKLIFAQQRILGYSNLTPYLIYNLQTNVLRGINSGESYIRPLGVSGEGLDILLSSFKGKELEIIQHYKFIDWLKNFFIDSYDSLKFQGYKLGRSKSQLYLRDKYMSRKNDVLSAENTNEGALHAMFYLALMVSEITPPFFAIDNIDNSLNPRLCENIIRAIVQLSEKRTKQVLIATQNPAILDGLDLKDPEQRLFVVKRNLKGHTIVQRVETKPVSEKKYRLSELFIEDYIGGLNPIM
jgi:predicted ATPase